MYDVQMKVLGDNYSTSDILYLETQSKAQLTISFKVNGVLVPVNKYTWKTESKYCSIDL